jgi:hypothetical protein
MLNVNVNVKSVNDTNIVHLNILGVLWLKVDESLQRNLGFKNCFYVSVLLIIIFVNFTTLKSKENWP